MALVNPNIAMSYKPTTEYQPRNALAEYAQIQQIQGGQMQMAKLKRDEEALDTMMQTITAEGGPSDPMVAADAMIKSRNPNFMAAGLAIQQTHRDTQRTRAVLGLPPLPSTGAPAATSTAQPTNALAPTPPTSGALGSGTFDPMAPAAPNNAMVPAAAPAAPTNAMVAGGKSPEEMQALEMMLSPVEAIRAAGTANYKNLKESQVVAPGGTVLRGNQVVYTAPGATGTPSTLTRLMNEMDALPPNDPRRAIYQSQINKETTHAPRAVTTVINTQEKAEAGEFGKFLVKDYENISKRAEVAQKSLSAIDANLNILNKGFETGFGTETKAAAAKVLSALGVEKANMFATNAQVFEAKAAEAILETLRQQLGPQTDADAKRVTLTGAQLANTTNSNKFLLDVAKVTNKRELEQRNFYNNWRKTNGSFDGAEEAWIAGEGGKSIFDRPELKKYVSSTLDAPATQIPTTNASVAPTARPIPPAAVQMLLSGKGTDAQFDAQFGAGAAKRARGSK
jgi:hypothetical protein